MSAPPDGFELLNTASPFNLMVGPYYCQSRDDGLVLGMWVEAQHCNSAGRLHGAMVNALADIALGHNIGLALAAAADVSPEGGTPDQGAPRAPIATVSMTTDFVGTAREGDWIEVVVDVQKTGRTLAFANAYLHRDDQRIARTSAVFAILGA